MNGITERYCLRCCAYTKHLDGSCLKHVYMKENPNRKFIIVIDPYNSYPESYSTQRKVYNLDEAIEASKRLAANNPGKKYYVCEIKGYSTISNAVYYQND